MNKSKILSQETVFQSKYFRVNKVVLEKDGKQMTKDIIERNPFVIILPMTENDEIYLVRQYRDALKQMTLEVVAGTINEEEIDPLTTAQRELQEETGLTAKQWKQINTIENSGTLSQHTYIFVARDLTEGAVSFDDDEDIETIKIPFEEAKQKIFTGEITIASSISALLMYDCLKKEGKV
jgi:ADP-ribose pyrophosphatase